MAETLSKTAKLGTRKRFECADKPRLRHIAGLAYHSAARRCERNGNATCIVARDRSSDQFLFSQARDDHRHRALMRVRAKRELVDRKTRLFSQLAQYLELSPGHARFPLELSG